jgi:ribokinase
VLLSAGSINADFEMRIDTPPGPGKTSIARNLLPTSGGKAANRAVVARRLGLDARLFGCVGDDDRARQALAGPEREGVDLAGVRRIRGAFTAVSAILVPPDGDKTISLAPEANDAWSAEDAERLVRAVRDAPAGAVLAVDLEVPVDRIRLALEAAHARSIAVVLDPSPADRLPDALLPLVDHVAPNASEAGDITGIEIDGPDAAADAARRLRETGAGAAYVKLSDGGCVVATADGMARVIAPEDVDMVDQTGAGDAFAGALAVALLEGRSPVEAAVWAVAASTCAIGVYGSQESYPARGALEAMAARVRTE